MDVQKRIGYAVKSVWNLIKLCIDQTISANETQGITRMQGWIIRYIYRRMDIQDCFQHDLEIEFNIRRSTASGILQRMERDGLITRHPVDYDARCKKITLTPKAIGIQESVLRAIDQVEQRIANGLTDDEINTFFHILEKVKRNLE